MQSQWDLRLTPQSDHVICLSLLLRWRSLSGKTVVVKEGQGSVDRKGKGFHMTQLVMYIHGMLLTVRISRCVLLSRSAGQHAAGHLCRRPGSAAVSGVARARALSTKVAVLRLLFD